MSTEIPAEAELMTDEIRSVRAAVYENEIKIYSPDDLPGQSRLEVPKSLTELYQKKPFAVLNVLLAIADGANPRESVLAISYVFELLIGPGRGVVCARTFDEQRYDMLDTDWEMTPRQHWLEKIRSHSESKGKDK